MNETPPSAEAVLTAPVIDETPPPRARRSFIALLAGLVLLLAAAGYLWKGTPDYAELAREAASQPAADPHVQAGMPDPQQLEEMVARLEQKLKDKPDDAEGWAMLGRVRAVQGRVDDALAAYTRAAALRPDDARVLVDRAEMLALKNNRSLAGEPTALLQQALKIAPDHPKALALAGAAAFDAKDYPGAVRHWERLVSLSDDQASYLEQVRQSIAEARRLGGMPPATGAAAMAAAPAQPPAASAAAPSTPSSPGTTGAAGVASVSGSVTLSPALAAQLTPEATLFIYARSAAAGAPRMPIAILKKQARELPLEFTLDDSMGMTPAFTLAKAGEVVLVARISKSGQAQQQPGDLVGESAPVRVGAKDVRLVIDRAVH